MSGLINYRGFNLNDTPSLQGKVCVITGGQSGIGKEMMAQLLLHDISKVYVLARSKEKFDEAVKYCQETHKLAHEDIVQRVAFMHCDLSDITDVKRVADVLRGKLDRLDVLIGNAGVPTVADYTLSPQGIETIWAASVVGHFTLLNILLPIIEKTAEKHGDARIALTASSLHSNCEELNLDLTMSPTPTKNPHSLDSFWRYCRSKLGVILLAKELARRLNKKGANNVYANTFFPGNIPTEAMDTWKDLIGTAGAAAKGIFQFIGQSLGDAAASAIYLAASPEVAKKNQRGKYFIPIATEYEPSNLAQDPDLARNLWYWCDDKVTQALGKGWEGSESM